MALALDLRYHNMKRISQSPLTGLLDVRTPPEQMRSNQFRFRENFSSPDVGKLCRMPGFERLLSREENYGNMDLHDQLLPLQMYYENQNPNVSGADDITAWPDGAFCDTTLRTRSNLREPITFGAELVAEGGQRKMVVGTQSRLYVGNPNTRNWRLLGDGFGGNYDSSGKTRWSMAYLNGEAIFSNGIDIVHWTYNDGPSGCDMQSVHPIPDLAIIGVSSAAVVVEFKGFILLMNVVMNGRRYPTKIISSDSQNALGFDPGDTASIAAEVPLDDAVDHTILAAKVLVDELVVYTDKGIFIGTVTGEADNPISFRIHYGNADSDNRFLAYPNSLVSIGVSHFFAGRDALYVFSTYRRDPEIVDWVFAASGFPYRGSPGYAIIDPSKCNSHVAGFNGDTKEVYFSWVETGSTLPSKTLVLNFDTQFASLSDVGYTCFFSHRPDYRLSFRDWLLTKCACDMESLVANGFSFVKEAMPITLCTGSAPNSIWTSNTATFYGQTTENWAQEEADEDSLCSALNGQTLDDVCRECAGSGLFIGALSDDYCLKQIGTAYSREICTNAATGEGTLDGMNYTSFTGTYSYSGYYSIVRSAPMNFGSRLFKKTINRMIAQFEAEAQFTPCVVSMRIGYSYSPRDPNAAACGIQWMESDRAYLECPDPELAEGEVPNNELEFPFYTTGLWLYWEMKIASLTDQENLDSALIPATGGASCFSSMDAQVRNDSMRIKT